MKSSIKIHLQDLSRSASDCGIEVYAVGGALRDHLLQRTIVDIDFVCKNAPLLANCYSETHNHKQIPLDNTPGRETIRIALHKDFHFDLSEIQGNSLEEDLKRRDFTINALAMTLENFIAGNSEVIDPMAGRKDLSLKCIRMVSENNLLEDPLRLLRGLRFAALLDFEIDPDTQKVIQSNVSLIPQAAGERIHHELSLLTGAPYLPFNHLLDSGLIGEIIPKLKPCLKESRTLLEMIDQYLSKMDLLDSPKPQNFRSMLRLAGILYPLDQTQINEPTPKTYRKDSNVVHCLKELKFSNDEIKMIDRSLFFANQIIHTLSELSGTEAFDNQAYHLVKDWDGEEWIALSLASCIQRSSGRKSIDSGIQSLYRFYANQYLPEKNKPAFFDGNLLSSRLNIKPSSRFKEILADIEKARILGRISTADEAEQLARKLIQSN